MGRRSRVLERMAQANIACLLLLCVGETAVGEQHWLTTLATYAPQHLFIIPTAVLLLWAAVRRSLRALAWNGAAMVFFLFAFMGLSLPLQRLGSSPGGSDFTVMTLNIHHGSAGAASIVEAIHEADPDIVCLQETNAYQHWPDPIPEIMEHLPAWSVARHGELAILTPSKFRSRQVHPLPVKTGRVILEARVAGDGWDVTVLNTHLNTADPATAPARRLSGLPAYVRHTAEVRSSQIAFLREVAGKVSGPVIIAGDFNTPPRGRQYRRMTADYRDAFASAGTGFGYTYHRRLPVMRIDYILCSRDLAVDSCRTMQTSASDHRPVLARLAIAP